MSSELVRFIIEMDYYDDAEVTITMVAPYIQFTSDTTVEIKLTIQNTGDLDLGRMIIELHRTTETYRIKTNFRKTLGTGFSILFKEMKF